MIRWDIYENRDGTCDVHKSGKAFAYDIAKEEAERKIKKSRYWNDKQSIVFHAADGRRKTIKEQK